MPHAAAGRRGACSSPSRRMRSCALLAIRPPLERGDRSHERSVPAPLRPEDALQVGGAQPLRRRMHRRGDQQRIVTRQRIGGRALRLLLPDPLGLRERHERQQPGRSGPRVAVAGRYPVERLEEPLHVRGSAGDRIRSGVRALLHGGCEGASHLRLLILEGALKEPGGNLSRHPSEGPGPPARGTLALRDPRPLRDSRRPRSSGETGAAPSRSCAESATLELGSLRPRSRIKGPRLGGPHIREGVHRTVPDPRLRAVEAFGELPEVLSHLERS